MELVLQEYVHGAVILASTYRLQIVVGLVTVACGTLAYTALKRHFGGGVCRSKALLTGKTAIITGANTGIGLETAVDLARRGARVILACRSAEKGEAAVIDVKGRGGSRDVVFSKLDLASLLSVREFAERTLEQEPRIDILVNNAGVMMPPYTLTEDGFELQFGVNHLGHFLLTNLLLDRIKEAPAARVINVSSLLHDMGKINFVDLQRGQSYSSLEAYGQSKLANILFTKVLAQKLAGTSVTAYALHPGVILTELIPIPAVLRSITKFSFKLFFKSPWQGAQTTIHCAVSEGIEGLSGQYFADCKVKQVTHPQATDDTVANRLWHVSAQLVGMENKPQN